MHEATYRCQMTVPCPFGLHLRPASLLARFAQQFEADIMIKSGRLTVDAKSVIGLMTLGVPPGGNVTLTSRGPDAKTAHEQLRTHFISFFEIPAASAMAEVSG